MHKLTVMPKYKAYKDSGIEFAGEVPTNWLIMPIRAILEERNEKNIGPKTDHILSVTKDRGVIPYDEKGAIGNNKSEDIERYKIVYKNDLVINKMNVVIGSLGLSKYYGALSQVYIVLKPRTDQFNVSYYTYLFINEPFYKSLIKFCTGIMELRESLNKNEFKKLFLPFPSLLEQTAIANFLDKKTVQINKAITIKERQIQLLKEYQQIIIQKAVTQGLDSNVPMKDSGVEWVGKIPKHYEILPMKRVAKLSPSINLHNQKSKNKMCFLPMEKVSTDGEIICDVKVQIKDVSQGFTIFNKNDVIVAKITPCFENGKSAFLSNLETDYGYGSTEFHVLRASEKILGKFLYYIVHSHLFLKTGESMMTGSAGQKRVPSSFINSFTVVLPSIDNQKKVINFIEKESSKIKSAISIQHQQIQKLKEYKTTLINSAVTGKIKVINNDRPNY